MANMPHIANEKDYNLALARMDEIFHAAIGTREGDERDLLFDLIEAYEEQRHPVELPSIPAAIEFHMEQLGLTPGDLAPLVGSQKAAAAVLSGKMDITIAMARALHKHWGIPAEVLLQEPSEKLKSNIIEPAVSHQQAVP